MPQVTSNFKHEFREISKRGVKGLSIKFMYASKPWASKWMPTDTVESIDSVIKHLTELKKSLESK